MVIAVVNMFMKMILVNGNKQALLVLVNFVAMVLHFQECRFIKTGLNQQLVHYN
jgi:hypothetical protein